MLNFLCIEGGHGSRSGSQHGSRDNSAARNSYSSRSLQMRSPMPYPGNVLPMNASQTNQKGLRSENKVFFSHHNLLYNLLHFSCSISNSHYLRHQHLYRIIHQQHQQPNSEK